MGTSHSDYVSLRVRERRYIGTWSALQNIIVHNGILRKRELTFTVPVKHVEIEGIPNKFSAVEFRQIAILSVIDTKLSTEERPIRAYEALTAEMSDNHIAVLHRALTDHGCCQAQPLCNYQLGLYRL